jgi:transcriptional regulator GlxA family with amidase domain
MLMAETGLLDGHEATIHWASETRVSGPTPERLVAHGRGARRVRGR